jgi:uncharacterized protein
MFVDIHELRDRGTPLVVEADFGEQELKLANPVSALERPARARLRVTLSGNRLQVAGRVEADMEITCSRCLNKIHRSIESNFELEYWPDPAVENEGEEFELTYSDLDIGFYRDERLDLDAVICEQILLEVPMKPVCRQDCKGLCGQCGADLNEGACGCDLVVTDPRLAVLANLKKKLN